MPENPRFPINTLNEKALHAELKGWYARPGDRLEQCVDGFIVDILQGELLVEIQTRSFSSIRRKLTRLAVRHRVRLVYPIARDKWIINEAADGQSRARRRKSPLRGRLEHLFKELVSIPTLLAHENFSLEVLLIQEEETRRPNARPGWRRKPWLTHERRLLGVLERRLFTSPAELGLLLPCTLAPAFSTADLAAALSVPRRLAQQMAYCLRELGTIEAAGKSGNAVLYQRKAAPCRLPRAAGAPRPV